jgi:hypothetical protein
LRKRSPACGSFSEINWMCHFYSDRSVGAAANPQANQRAARITFR